MCLCILLVCVCACVCVRLVSPWVCCMPGSPSTGPTLVPTQSYLSIHITSTTNLHKLKGVCDCDPPVPCVRHDCKKKDMEVGDGTQCLWMSSGFDEVREGGGGQLWNLWNVSSFISLAQKHGKMAGDGWRLKQRNRGPNRTNNLFLSFVKKDNIDLVGLMDMCMFNFVLC